MSLLSRTYKHFTLFTHNGVIMFILSRLEVIF